MLKAIPLNLIETIIKPPLDLFDLKNFFGFIEVEIICPDSVLNPILPVKSEGRTIYPRGLIKGVYFAEEIKDAIR